MQKTILGQAHRAMIEEVPHNTCQVVLDRAGVDYDRDVFGYSCSGGSAKLSKDLDVYGIQSNVVKSINGPHAALFSNADGEVMFTDPSLLHFDPLSVTGLVMTGIEQASDAYPIVDGRPSRFSIRLDDTDPTFMVAGYKIPKGVNGNYLSLWSHKYDLTAIDKPFQPLPFNVQNYHAFSLKYLDPRLAGHIRIMRIDLADVLNQVVKLRDLGETAKGKDSSCVVGWSAIDEISDSLSITRGKLLDFVARTKMAYERLGGGHSIAQENKGILAAV